MNARVRFAAEETEVASETVEAMARVTRAIDWFRGHENDMDEVDNAEECRQHLAALQLLPHIINDEAGADTVREYMTMPGEDQEELRKHLNGLQEMKLYFSADKPAFMDPECHDYFVSRLKAGEDWERRQENYQFLLDCMLGAINQIKFESDEDKIEYTTYYAALLALKTGAGVRTMMKDEKGDPMVDKNNQPKYVQVDDVADAIELLADKDFNNFLYKKYKTVGDDDKSASSVFEFLNNKVKQSNLIAYKNQKLKNEISFPQSTVNKEIENETKRAGEWIIDIKAHNEPKNYFERGDGESGYTTNQHMLAQIRLEAARIKKQIDKERKSEDPDQEKLLKLQEKGNKLILEYSIIHDESLRIVNGRQVGTGANIRWNDVNAAMARRMGMPRYAMLEGAGSVEQTGNALYTLAKNSPKDYFNRQLINHDEEPNLVLNRIEDDLINKERQSEKSNASESVDKKNDRNDDMNRTIDSIDLDAEEEKKQIAEDEMKMNTNLL